MGTEGEVNLGFIARLAENFAVDEVYLVSPKVDPRSPEAKRYSAKAVKTLEEMVVVGDLREALKGVELSACTSAKVGQKSDVLRHPVTPRQFAEIVASQGYSSIAVVFGRESVGLTREELSLCDVLVTIPASKKYPVLNLSHAVAIILYELWLVKSRATYFHEEADPEAVRRLRPFIEEIASIVVEEQRRSQAVAAAMHCIVKAGLTRGEASLLYYFLKKIASLLKTCSETCLARQGSPGEGLGGKTSGRA